MNRIVDTVFNLRYVAILAVIAPIFGAVLMLIVGTRDTVEAYAIFFGLERPEGAASAGEAAMIRLVASVDHFLFSAILLIFAVGLYSLFFKGSAPHSARGDDSSGSSLSWKRLKNMGGMDELLLKVIIMLLAVSFLEFMLTSGIDNLSWSVLVVPLTIIALAIGLRLMSTAAEEESSIEIRTDDRRVQENRDLDD